MQEAVLAPPPAPRPRRVLPALAWRPIALLTGLFVAAHLAVSPFGGYWLDEVYMLAAGRYHPSWGYADQPPLAPLLAGAMEWLAPNSMLLLRLPAAVISATGVLLAALLAREFGGERRAQVLTALAFATGLWMTLTAHWITPYTLEVPLWMALTWLLARWVRQDAQGRADDGSLLALGVVIGVTMQVKVQVAVLCAALLGCLLVFGPRHLLRRPMFWACAGIALLIATPSVVWQAVHGWPQLAMGEVVAREAPLLSGGRAGMALGGVLCAGLLGAPLAGYGTWRLLVAAEMRPYRFVGAAVVAQYVFYIITSGRPYYLVGLYGVVMAAGAVGMQRRREVKGVARTWVAWSGGALAALSGIGLLVLLLISNFWSEPVDRSLARNTAAAYHALPAGARAQTAVVGGHYVGAAVLDAHADEYGMPLSHSAHRGYGYFGPPPETARDVLLVDSDPAEWRPHFAQIRQVRGGSIPVWLLTGRQEPWPQLWAQVRSLG